MATTARFTYHILRTSYMYFLNVCGGLNKYRSDPNEIPWAVVTGGSDGIGLGFAEELIKQRFHVLLVGRSREKLAATVAMLQANNVHQVNIEFVIAEASDISSANVGKVAEFFKDKSGSLALLVNNVGCALPMMELQNQDAEELVRLIDVNCTYPTLLTRSLLPFLKLRKRSCIINLSSNSVYLNTPFLTAYAASKAYNRTFSRALSVELSGHPIDVVSVHPSYTATNMVKLKSSLFVLDPQTVARGTLKKTTWREIIPNFPHFVATRFYQCLFGILPMNTTRSYLQRYTKKN